MDEQETRDHRPENAADRVGRIGSARFAAGRPRATGGKVGEQREDQTQSDRRRRNNEDQWDGVQCHHRPAVEERDLERADDVHREHAEERKQQGRCHGRGALNDRGAHQQRARRQARSDGHEAAQADAEQEAGQDRRKGVRRAADHQHQHARPRDLVEQRSKGRDPDDPQSEPARAFIHGFRRGGGCGSDASFGFAPPDQRKRHGAERQVQHSGPEQRLPKPDVLDQDDTGEHASGHAANRVEAVEEREFVPQPVGARARKRAREYGERAAHEEGRNQHHGERAQELDRRRSPQLRLRHTRERQIGGADAAEDQW